MNDEFAEEAQKKRISELEAENQRLRDICLNANHRLLDVVSHLTVQRDVVEQVARLVKSVADH